jgi:hydroxymethylbilane synthase
VNHRPIRIGTRGSPLALAQTKEVYGLLMAAANIAEADEAKPEIVVIRTTGDAILDRPLAEIGGKALFTREIDDAMLEGKIDLAVHSVKDLPTPLPDGIAIVAVLRRRDPRDAFLSLTAKSLAELPEGALVGTASVRRQAQVLRVRPDLRVEPMRGNVGTRLAKLESGEAAATFLAIAGLQQLDKADAATMILEPEDMLPAVGQGAIAITARAGDADLAGMVKPLNDDIAFTEIDAERAMLAALGGSCRTPIAGLARAGDSGRLTLRGLVARVDGTLFLATDRAGSHTDAAAMGHDAGEELKRRGGSDFLTA